MKNLMTLVEEADRVLLIKNGDVKADISWVSENKWQAAEIGDTYFQEVSTKYIEDLLKLWRALKGKIEHKDGLMTIYLK